MKKFTDFASLARHFETRLPHIEAAQHVALEVIAEKIEEKAKAKIGEYQSQTGPFPAWAQLADSTLNGWDSPWGVHYPGKIELGFSPPDNPLLRTGDLRASYTHTVGAHDAVIGSPLQLAVWQEMGTPRIPPRPVIGPAAYDMRDSIIKGVIYATLRGFKEG